MYSSNSNMANGRGSSPRMTPDRPGQAATRTYMEYVTHTHSTVTCKKHIATKIANFQVTYGNRTIYSTIKSFTHPAFNYENFLQSLAKTSA